MRPDARGRVHRTPIYYEHRAPAALNDVDDQGSEIRVITRDPV